MLRHPRSVQVSLENMRRSIGTITADQNLPTIGTQAYAKEIIRFVSGPDQLGFPGRNDRDLARHRNLGSTVIDQFPRRGRIWLEFNDSFRSLRSVASQFRACIEYADRSTYVEGKVPHLGAKFVGDALHKHDVGIGRHREPAAGQAKVVRINNIHYVCQFLDQRHQLVLGTWIHSYAEGDHVVQGSIRNPNAESIQAMVVGIGNVNDGLRTASGTTHGNGAIGRRGQ